MIFDASDNSFTTGPELPNWLVTGACTIFNSAMHENRPVVFAGSGYENKAQLLDYSLTNTTWEESKHHFRLVKVITYVYINCKKTCIAVGLLLEFFLICVLDK